MTDRLVEPAVITKTAKKWGKFAVFEGCTMSRRQVGSRFATRFLHDKYGFDYVMIDKEKCCGSPVRRAGASGDADKLRNDNLTLVSRLGVDKMITACPGCSSQLLSDRSDELGIKVHHYLEVLFSLARNNELYVKKAMWNPLPKYKICAHVPCHLGRGMNIDADLMYKTIVESMPGWTWVQMEEADRCCGAGGGVRASQKDLSFQIRERKMEYIKNADVDLCLAACPFCELQIDEGLREINDEEAGINYGRAITPQSLIATMFRDVGKEVDAL